MRIVIVKKLFSCLKMKKKWSAKFWCWVKGIPAKPEHRPVVGGVYFDITDVVHFAMRENRVTGIQRVQIRMVNAFAELRGESTFIAYEDPLDGRMTVLPARGLLGGVEFDAVLLLAKLGLISWRRFPKKKQIVGLLEGKPGRFRVWGEQLKVYAMAFFSPLKLSQKGILTAGRSSRGLRISSEFVSTGLGGCALVFLGTNWKYAGVHRFASLAKMEGCRVYQLVHDLIPIRQPHFCGGAVTADFSGFLDASLMFASHYLAVSDYTARDLAAYLSSKGFRRSVEVLKLAHEFSGFSRGEVLDPPPGVSKPYFLFVGTLDRRKNIENLLQAWLRLKDESSDAMMPALVIAGKPGWDSADFFDALCVSGELGRSIVYERAPSDELLARLYANCEAVILPSYAEGWGLPVGEAAWFGKPSIISNCSSLPEVCPDLSFLLDGLDAESIAQGVMRFMARGKKLSSSDGVWRSASSVSLRTWRDVACRLSEVIDADERMDDRINLIG
ncbi:glycosyltransferase family 4 protein [Aquabacterium sp. UBA2148]|uniref:glycosyltransferase family 4 protein n=1 Tax=Aquabacterium sp. UBA2148 TaxID=1946042 RepID=UPI00257AA133|nr:glycosyltransferase family 1 protein [Aquabacterium sp. UBA2148]